MKKLRYSFSALLIFITVSLFGQQKLIPANIDQAISFLVEHSPENFKQNIKTHKNDTLRSFIDPLSADKQSYKAISEWTSSDEGKETAIQKFYSALGIMDIENIESIILISFKNYLNTGITNHSEVIKPFQALEKRERAEDKIRYKADSLRGNYVPTDITDCFRILDKDLTPIVQSDMRTIAEKDVVGKTHLGLGTWMRNRCRLWWGSRLTRYFNKKGVYGAENMSCIILMSYHRHLNNVSIDFEGQIKKMIIEQNALQEPSKKMFPKGSGNLEFNSGCYYDRHDGGLGLAQFGTSPESKDVWLYDYYFGWKKVSNDELSALNKATTETREDVLIKIFKKE